LVDLVKALLNAGFAFLAHRRGLRSWERSLQQGLNPPTPTHVLQSLLLECMIAIGDHNQ
jgi:hypothetical protein